MFEAIIAHIIKIMIIEIIAVGQNLIVMSGGRSHTGHTPVELTHPPGC